MCEVLEVSRAGYYRWCDRQLSRQQQANDDLLAFLLRQAQVQDGIPGYRKLWVEAVAEGYHCSKNRVQRLLQDAGYRSCTSRRPGYRKPAPGLPVLPNLLNRQFAVAKANRVWVSDITQIRCQEGWLYLAVVMDLHSRRIVGWATGAQNTSGLVVEALKLAWKKRRPLGGDLLFHSDQGCQYRSEAVMSWLTRRGVTISMSRRGNCWDNACAESFFALLKKEWTNRLGLLSRKEMQAEIHYYIEEYYNVIRRHGSLGDLSPQAFETAA